MSKAQAPGRLKHPVDEVLAPQKLAVYGLQHVMAFYAGAVVVPILLAGAIGLNQDQLIHLINADLFTCGIASMLQTVGIWKIGVRLPLLQGVTFTAVSPMIVIGLDNGGGTAGLVYIYGAVIVAGHLHVPDRAVLQQAGAVLPAGGDRHGDHDHRRHADPGRGDGRRRRAVRVLQPRPWCPPNLTFGSPTNLALSFGTILVILLITRYARGFLQHGRRAGRAGRRHRRSRRSSATARAARSPSSTRSAAPTGSASPARSTSARRSSRVRADPADDRGHADHRGRDHR